jgi:hypothetical protein
MEKCIFACRNIVFRLHFDNNGMTTDWHLTTWMVRISFYQFTFWLVNIVITILFLSGKIKWLTMSDAGKVWMPDTFFRNEKHGQFHNIIQPNLYIRVFPNGDILYSIRYVKKKLVKKLVWFMVMFFTEFLLRLLAQWVLNCFPLTPKSASLELQVVSVWKLICCKYLHQKL